MDTIFEIQELKTYLYPLIMIAALGIPVGESNLSIACRVSRMTARRWLVALDGLDYLSREAIHNGYLLTPLAVQVIGNFVTTIGNNLANFDNFLAISSPTTTDSLSIHSLEKDIEEETANGNNLANSDNFLAISSEIYDALRSCGIGEPKRSILARLPFMTLDYIERWKSDLRERGKLIPGLLIHCLETGEPPVEPESESRGESVLGQMLKSYSSHSFLAAGVLTSAGD